MHHICITYAPLTPVAGATSQRSNLDGTTTFRAARCSEDNYTNGLAPGDVAPPGRMIVTYTNGLAPGDVAPPGRMLLPGLVLSPHTHSYPAVG